MVHPDIDTRVGAHHMFSAIIVRGPSHLRSESEYLYETKKQSRNTSVFASATALLEKLRREKDSLSSDKPRNMMHDDVKERNTHEEDNKYVWLQKNSAYFSKLIFSIIERYAKLSSSVEVYFRLKWSSLVSLPSLQIFPLAISFIKVYHQLFPRTNVSGGQYSHVN